MITAERLKKLDELHIEIECCCILGLGEITLNCNGTNPGEAMNTIRAVYHMLGLSSPDVTDDDLRLYVEKLGLDPDEYL